VHDNNFRGGQQTFTGHASTGSSMSKVYRPPVPTFTPRNGPQGGAGGGGGPGQTRGPQSGGGNGSGQTRGPQGGNERH